MAETYYFFDDLEGDERAYNTADFAEFFAGFIGNGIVFLGDNLKIDIDYRMDIAVNTGKAWINGRYYNNRDTVKIMTVQPADASYTRIDRVVLRLDLREQIGSRKISAEIKTGIPAASPVAPTLQRDNEIWELGLADITVNPGVKEVLQSNIFDLRMDAEMCGEVSGLFEQPDLTAIYNQYAAKWQECEAKMAADEATYNSWWAAFVETADIVWAGFKQTWTDHIADFDAWYAKAKAQVCVLSNSDFEDKSTKLGYKLHTVFNADGSITATWQNAGANAHVLAQCTTVFNNDGSIVATEEWPDLNLKFSTVTIFNKDGSIDSLVTGIGVVA